LGSSRFLSPLFPQASPYRSVDTYNAFEGANFGLHMINFPCKCGHRFELPDDMAGGLIQCPKCGLLADVPGLGDLANMEEDGTIKLDEAPPASDPHQLAQLHRVFTRSTYDAGGHERDQRNEVDDYDLVGDPTDAIPQRATPRYDPETGELIRPLDIKPTEAELVPVIAIDEHGNEIMPVEVIPAEPIAPMKSVAYATGDARKSVTPFTILVELFMPSNVIVIFFVFLMYLGSGLLGNMLMVMGRFMMNLPLQILNVPSWLVLAHYGCVIEETGPDMQNELPRPLRHLQIAEDLWNPFFRVFLAMIICFAPAIALASLVPPSSPPQLAIIMVVQLIGVFFFPAVLLTSVTSGSPENLRPDRILGVIRVAAGDYIFVVGVFLLTLLPSAVFLGGARFLPENLALKFLHYMSRPYVHLPVLAATVYLMHYFCWLLGLIYRDHHAAFPWVLQRHDFKNVKAEAMMHMPKRGNYQPRDRR